MVQSKVHKYLDFIKIKKNYIDWKSSRFKFIPK